jgi:hypothetical protein
VGAKVIPLVGPEKNKVRSEEKLYVYAGGRGRARITGARERGEDRGGGQNRLLAL